MIVCHTVGNWGFYSIINMMPKFMGNYQQYDVKQIGWMSAIPYLLQTVTVLGATWFSDFLRVSFKGVTRLEQKLKIKLEQIWIQKSLHSKIVCIVGDDISSDFLIRRIHMKKSKPYFTENFRDARGLAPFIFNFCSNLVTPLKLTRKKSENQVAPRTVTV